MSGASFRKILFFGPGRRLAASEAPKIAGGGLAGAKGKPTLSALGPPPRSSFYAFPFCAIEAQLY